MTFPEGRPAEEPVLPGEPAGDRRSRSRQALVSRFPALEKMLDEPAVLTPVRDGDTVIDLDLERARLYSGDGRAFAAEQVANYLKRPLRFFVTDLSGTNLASGVSTRLYFKLLNSCRDLGISFDDLDVKPRYEGCFLIVLGLGLGFHLDELIEKTEAGHIIIVDPYEEFLRQSLETVDWEDLLSRGEQRGCTFDFVITGSPDAAGRIITALLVQHGAHFIDGAYVYLHYPARLLTEVRDNLVETVQTLYTSRGFYEDELIMLDNTSANLARHEFWWLQNKLRPERPEPAFVIGSGPSIDRSIEDVKRLRERAIVFSCGSGLRVCLDNGIVPDFHCEIENGPWVFDALSLIRSQFPFTGITLVASATVDPRIPALFDDRVLFFRDTVTGSRILASRDQELYLAVPTVANTALRTALSLGFGTFYLFGIDCGTKSSAKRHSDSAIYTHSETLRTMVERTELGFSHPGNFGGTVRADWLFVFSRMLLEELGRLYRPQTFNCSDGARIGYTVPKASASIVLPELGRDRAAIRQELFGQLVRCQPGQLLNGIAYRECIEDTTRYREEGLAMIDAALAEDKNFVEFWRRLDAFLSHSVKTYIKPSSPINCSLLSMPKIGMFFVHRLRDRALRAELFRAFLAEYRAIFDFMCENLMSRLTELAAEHGPAAPDKKAVAEPAATS